MYRRESMAREHAAMARSPDCFPQVSQSSAAAMVGKRATAASAASPSDANFERRIFIPPDEQAVEPAYPRTQAPQGHALPAHIGSGSGVRPRTTLSTRQKSLRKQTESLQRGERRKCASYCREHVQQSTGQDAPKQTNDGQGPSIASMPEGIDNSSGRPRTAIQSSLPLQS